MKSQLKNRTGILTYAEARADHEYLWKTYGPAYDMTGGYVDQEDLWMMLASPTKATATKCYVAQIDYWFQSGCDDSGFNPASINWDDPKVREIAERHGHDAPST